MKGLPRQGDPGRFEAGFSMVELVVVLVLIGALSAVAAVYISGGETALRSSVQNFRFDLEAAKSEAVTRRAEVYIDFFTDTPSFDCDGDGTISRKDRCYVLFQDLNGNQAYDADAEPPEKIRSATLQHSVGFPAPPQRLTFYPLGGTEEATLRWEAAVPSDCNDASSGQECLVSSYEVSIYSSGRVRVGDREQRCESMAYCP